jgi:PKD repeat protein
MAKALRLFFSCAVLMLCAVLATAQPLANFSASSVSGCYPLTVSFTNLSTGGAGTWYWDFGNGATSTLQNPSATFINPGTYTVTLVATSPSGSDTESRVNYITVYSPPRFTFSATTTAGCPGFSTRFSANVTANAYGQLSYVWDFGDGTSNSALDSPTHIYATPGSYTVSLTLRNGQGCDTSISHAGYIKVYTPPIANFAANQTTFCIATPVTAAFSNTSTGFNPMTASWTFGDGGTATANNTPTHIYNSGGLFTVSMTTTDGNGCTGTAVKSDYIGVYDAPVTYTGPTSSCFGDTLYFVNTTTGGIHCTWNFGDGTPLDSSCFPQHVYAATGTYTIILSTKVGPCTKTLPIQLVNHPRPATTITYSPALPCPAPDTVTYTAATSNSSSVSYLWDFMDSTSATTNPASHIYYTNGYKEVRVTTTDNLTGCSAIASLTDVPMDALLPAIFPSQEGKGCIPFSPILPLILYGSLPPGPGPPPYPLPAISWNWTFSSGIPATSTDSVPTSTWSAVGTYMVQVTGVTANGCPFQASVPIHADTGVQPDFYASPLAACVNTPVVFTNLTPNLPGTTFRWSTGNGTEAFYPPDTFIYETAGLKNAALFSDHNGCVLTKIRYQYIEVHPSDAKFKFALECPPHYTAHFTDLSDSADDWNWDFGDGTSDTVRNPIHTYAAPGIYYVLLTTHNYTYGCSDTERVEVEIQSDSLSITANKTIACTNDLIDFAGYYNGPHPYIRCAWLFDQDTATFLSITTQRQWSFATTGYHDVRFIVMSGDTSITCRDTLYVPNYIFISRPNVAFATLPPVGCTPMQVTLVDSSSPVPGTSLVSHAWRFGTGMKIPATGTITTHNYPLAIRDSVTLYVTDDIGCEDSLKKYVEARKPVADFSVADTVICIGQDLSFTNLSTGVTALS